MQTGFEIVHGMSTHNLHNLNKMRKVAWLFWPIYPFSVQRQILKFIFQGYCLKQHSDYIINRRGLLYFFRNVCQRRCHTPLPIKFFAKLWNDTILGKRHFLPRQIQIGKDKVLFHIIIIKPRGLNQVIFLKWNGHFYYYKSDLQLR